MISSSMPLPFKSIALANLPVVPASANEKLGQQALHLDFNARRYAT